ncbi:MULTISPECIES: tRNA (adenosine(37)-N6)-threonylcarbamoyltransferase complex dimerization subunit type 1 TsaB [Tenebrionibacter/Tenebrionicola group]|jgi:tRNA threonylcarbamoyladenosine biosynthesis protein TsaB|uniref:tRNA threonylcarbamoyladenosine biosynthesis protein TsaB n=1 Tax=Tenebrionibacter intestinalis TaxID=2799638 RepID=A0A8K0UZR6_9ENTR|nr:MULTISPECIES: tRNA (adenosine(37)-N6)-threonylcarbamoyltransferase complex dimerization subunit type 1 TsaB [Tenebrionibacter/Tenebrionicola group]MBK4713842.1 tRNA (adenosine(37)-N6)-threonylcarbamoyltransferase complex dimerization subunit type 1 TsaB [Tenebrionibacter intestinalis]MBV4411547.1 tRNA (adenosine(37)-N6)-threonylcarbamoyltransferase complex dimerization subunit type 1 TsaB [Tenebrionicola larvae]
MRILAIDTATEACSVALELDNATLSHVELCPREHTQRILPMVRDILNQGGINLSEVDVLAFGRGPGSFTGVRIGIGIAQGLALGAALPMVGVSTLAAMAQGAFRKQSATRVLAAIDARMGEVYWAEYQRDASGIWRGEETETVLKPEAVCARLKQLEGDWVTVGTGWQAWPMMANDCGLALKDGGVLLPAAEDMLPLARYGVAQQRTVAAEKAEPVYLRNEVAWRKLPGRE